MSSADLRQRIAERIAKGDDLLNSPISSPEELEDARNQYYKWTDYNREMLRQAATTDELSRGYSFHIGSAGPGRTFEKTVSDHRQDIRREMHRLESISERLDLIPVAEDVRPHERSPVVSPCVGGGPVFVVHGHDGEAREAVARFIEKLGFELVILHEQPNQGRTVIEKLEAHSDVGFAVVLLTPDDEGHKMGCPDPLKPRARQNVLLELGFFLGRLGREHVCALHRGQVEIPTDYVGVVYVLLDEGGAWQLRLAKELKAAGYHVDMNLVV